MKLGGTRGFCSKNRKKSELLGRGTGKVTQKIVKRGWGVNGKAKYTQMPEPEEEVKKAGNKEGGHSKED